MAIQQPTADDVRAIITTSLTDPQITAIIADATLIAENCIASFDGTRQAAILKYLAAHLISGIKNQGGGALTSESLGDASRSYATGSFGKQLESTGYGQAALQLDPNGCLARLGKARASIEKV